MSRLWMVLLTICVCLCCACPSTSPNQPDEGVDNGNDNSTENGNDNVSQNDNENSSDSDDDNVNDNGSEASVSTFAAELSLAQTGETAAGNLVLASSTRLRAAWSPPATDVDHFQLDLRDTQSEHSRTIIISGSSSEVELTDLFSATSYEANLRACLDSECGEFIDADAPVSATTEEEYWRLVVQDENGEESLSNAHLIVEDGNAKVFAAGFGAQAPDEVAGRVQLYYGATGIENSGLSVAVSKQVVTDAQTAGAFDSFAGTYGAVKPQEPTDLIELLLTGQAIPLRDAMGDHVRLYFEAIGADGSARIMYIDGQDGLLGRDFNSSQDTLCNQPEHYDANGDCEVTIVFGVTGDESAETPFENVRQFKIGYPTLNDWRWDGAAGTFMFLTVDQYAPCGFDFSHNQVYAMWDGEDWQIDFSGSCPNAMQGAQAPSVVHLGDGRYKLYFGDKRATQGQVMTGLPFLGPKVVLYADATRTGDPDVVEFADWDHRDTAREVHFIYPSGNLFDDGEEGYIDDFVMLTPNGDLDLQVLYGAWTDGEAFPMAAMFVLVNP